MRLLPILLSRNTWYLDYSLTFLSPYLTNNIILSILILDTPLLLLGVRIHLLRAINASTLSISANTKADNLSMVFRRCMHSEEGLFNVIYSLNRAEHIERERQCEGCTMMAHPHPQAHSHALEYFAGPPEHGTTLSGGKLVLRIFGNRPTLQSYINLSQRRRHEYR